MAAEVECLCLGAANNKCDFKPLRMKRRALGDYDVLIDMKYCGICHSDGASSCSRHALRTHAPLCCHSL